MKNCVPQENIITVSQYLCNIGIKLEIFPLKYYKCTNIASICQYKPREPIKYEGNIMTILAFHLKYLFRKAQYFCNIGIILKIFLMKCGIYTNIVNIIQENT